MSAHLDAVENGYTTPMCGRPGCCNMAIFFVAPGHAERLGANGRLVQRGQDVRGWCSMECVRLDGGLTSTREDGSRAATERRLEAEAVALRVSDVRRACGLLAASLANCGASERETYLAMVGNALADAPIPTAAPENRP